MNILEKNIQDSVKLSTLMSQVTCQTKDLMLKSSTSKAACLFTYLSIDIYFLG